jgi:hypothetical protein
MAEMLAAADRAGMAPHDRAAVRRAAAGA